MDKKVKALIVRVPTLPFPKEEGTVSLTSISSATFLIPLGAIYVATYAREIGGHEVEVLDLNISLLRASRKGEARGTLNPQEIVRGELERMLQDFKPRVVGFSAIFLPDEEWTLFCARSVKSLDPGVITVVGGSLATIETRKVLDSGVVDYCVVGEGEKVFNNLLASLSGRDSLSRVKGLAFLVDGEVRQNPWEDYIPDLDSIPMPDLALIPLPEYPRDVLNRIYLFTGRGCPANCTFCSSFRLWGRKVRRHSVGRVLQEIKRLRDVYHLAEFDFWDENFTIHPRWLAEFCTELDAENRRSGTTLRYSCPAGLMVKTLNPEALRMMHRTGCMEFRLAVESGSPRVAREVLNKPMDYGKILHLRDIVRDIGAALTSNFMMGMPGETIPEMEETAQFIGTLDCDWSIIAIFTPIPGTALYQKALQMGAIDPDAPRVRSSATLSTRDFSSEDVKRIQYDANIRWNFLHNRNVRRDANGLKTGFYRDFLRHVVDIYPRHIIGKIVLGYLYHLDGDQGKAEHWWRQARSDYAVPNIHKDFARYLDWREEAPLRAWETFVRERPGS